MISNSTAPGVLVSHHRKHLDKVFNMIKDWKFLSKILTEDEESKEPEKERKKSLGSLVVFLSSFVDLNNLLCSQ